MEGGTDSNHVYLTDPVNDFDLSGMIGWKKWFTSRGNNIASGVKKVQNFSDRHPDITNAALMLATRGRGKGGGEEGLRLPSEMPLRGRAVVDAASKLGCNTKTPFRSHGQPVFQRGSKYITPDVGTDGSSHKGGAWKMIDRQGGRFNRLGTYDKDLNRIGD